jgi:hypothetical protein
MVPLEFFIDVILPTALWAWVLLSLFFKFTLLQASWPWRGCRGIAVPILNLGTRRGGWTAPCPGRFTPGKHPVPIVTKAGWAPGPAWTCAKNLAPTGIFFLFLFYVSIYIYILCYIWVSFFAFTILLGFDPRTVQPVASRYTDWATRPTLLSL